MYTHYNVYSYYKSFYSLWIFLSTLDINLLEVECITPSEVDGHLQLGVQMLATGQLHEALSHFHAAIDGDPKNYLSYYRRATVYLALGRSRPGLQDLDEVLRARPEFSAARIQRAGVLLKLGRLDEAHIDLEKVLRKEQDNEEANRLYTLLEPLKLRIQQAVYSSQNGHYNEVIEYLKEIIEQCPWDASLRELRVEAYQSTGDILSAIADLRTITKLTQDNTQGFLKLAHLYYQNGDVEVGLNEVRECLKLDPDHKECFQFYKKIKKVSKLISDSQEYINNKEFEGCVTATTKILREERQVPEIHFMAYDKLCQCQRQTGDVTDAIKSCNMALAIKEDARIYCDRADAYLVEEMYDEAMNDFQKAMGLDDNLQRAKEGIDKVNKLRKQAGKRDYYKILGVKKSATKKEITKAYRSLAQKWHPDHFSGDEKVKAEKMFIDIASAKEVLTNEENRSKFDRGEDPLDPEQQQGQGFNPFQQFRQGGFPGGGPFQFRFHFN